MLELDRRFSPFYWTNVADPDVPFLGLIEQDDFVGPRRYGGRRFLYVANYMPPDDPLLRPRCDELLAATSPGCGGSTRTSTAPGCGQRWLFREPDAQPIVTVGYRERMPPLQTGVDGLLLANTTQVYPQDRGTNYAVRLGREAAAALIS